VQALGAALFILVKGGWGESGGGGLRMEVVLGLEVVMVRRREVLGRGQVSSGSLDNILVGVRGAGLGKGGIGEGIVGMRIMRAVMVVCR
jgi:hypothetical protein